MAKTPTGQRSWWTQSRRCRLTAGRDTAIRAIDQCDAATKLSVCAAHVHAPPIVIEVDVSIASMSSGLLSVSSS